MSIPSLLSLFFSLSGDSIEIDRSTIYIYIYKWTEASFSPFSAGRRPCSCICIYMKVDGEAQLHQLPRARIFAGGGGVREQHEPLLANPNNKKENLTKPV